ncbi:putative transcription factor WRKY family [Helianthus anomalus]
MAVDFVGIQSTDHHLNRMFQLLTHDLNVSSTYTHAVSAFKRTGHARFRRGPSSTTGVTNGPSTSSSSSHSEGKSRDTTSFVQNECVSNKSVTEITTTSTSSSSVVSSSTGGNLDGSVSNGKQFSSLGIVAPAPAFSSRKPPLPSTHRKRCSADRPVASVHGSGSGCHCCSKRRKTGSKREIRRVPITGSKITSIPADDYSWKKYGEKKIDGSLYPRVYYKCITGKGCPARKRVELSADDSKMLIVTYDGEHRHRDRHAPVPISLTGVYGESK